jgi:fructoselysine-6-P-deglycase FrlB-like protein
MKAPAGRVRGFVHEQSAALRSTLRGLVDEPFEALAAPVREVVLVGSGTSKNAAIATTPSFRGTHCCPVMVMGPLEFLRANPPGADALVVVVSQTGISTTSVEALAAAQGRGLRTVAITAEPHSPFGRAARDRCLLPIGPEPVGPKTKGYTATLATLHALAAATTSASAATGLPDPDGYANWFAARLPAWEALGRGWSERLHAVDHLMLIGADRHHGTALEASLKLQEMAGLPVSTFDLEEALHGRLHGLGPRSAAMFVVGDPRDERTALAAAAALTDLGVAATVVSTVPGGGGSVERIGRYPDADPAFDVVGAIVPFQFFADDAARARGLDPDAMRYPDMLARLGIKLPEGSEGSRPA